MTHTLPFNSIMNFQACGVYLFLKSPYFKWKVNATATGVLSARGLDLLERGLLTCFGNRAGLTSTSRTFEVFCHLWFGNTASNGRLLIAIMSLTFRMPRCKIMSLQAQILQRKGAFQSCQLSFISSGWRTQVFVLLVISERTHNTEPLDWKLLWMLLPKITLWATLSSWKRGCLLYSQYVLGSRTLHGCYTFN